MLSHYAKKIKEISRIKQDNFWQKWYDIELKRNKDKKGVIISDIETTLIVLQFPDDIIKNLIEKLNSNEFGEKTDL